MYCNSEKTKGVLFKASFSYFDHVSSWDHHLSLTIACTTTDDEFSVFVHTEKHSLWWKILDRDLIHVYRRSPQRSEGCEDVGSDEIVFTLLCPLRSSSTTCKKNNKEIWYNIDRFTKQHLTLTDKHMEAFHFLCSINLALAVSSQILVLLSLFSRLKLVQTPAARF